jgi:hypothetical protein
VIGIDYGTISTGILGALPTVFLGILALAVALHLKVTLAERRCRKRANRIAELYHAAITVKGPRVHARLGQHLHAVERSSGALVLALEEGRSEEATVIAARLHLHLRGLSEVVR